ncbi:unnamed protein product [Camellia sinensis]
MVKRVSPEIPMAKSSPVSVLKAYWFPLILFASSMFYQLLILPHSYPPSHYDVLGIKRYSSMEQVTEAYEKFSSKWNSGTEVPPITEFIKPYPGDRDFEVITSGNFLSKFENSKALLIQKIASLLDGMANTGMVEFGEVQLATYLAEKTFIGYEGELSVDAVTNWFATTILSLPRILYYSKDSLRRFGVESAPAIVFLKEHGVKPVVYHGPANNSWFVDIMEQNKHQEASTIDKCDVHGAGCDARGYSRAGNETAIWYCLILAGRSSLELNKMRARIQEALSIVDNDQPSSPAAVALKEKRLTFTWLNGEAQQVGITIGYQKTPSQLPYALYSRARYCSFHTQTENNYETCGPRRDIIDIPQLIIVCYKRNATEDSIKIEEKKPKNMLEAFLNDDVDPASQLVARYNGSEESSEIIKWISQIIEDGDSRELPFFRAKTPALVPEDADPIWSVGAKTILSKGTGMKQRIGSIMNGIHNRLGDPRIGPVLLLGALMSFGGI